MSSSAAEPSAGVEALVTVVITSSPVRSNPSTRMLMECLASLDRHGDLSACKKVIMCDGFKVRSRSQLKQGVCTDEEAVLYRAFVHKVASLCREHPAFKRTRVVRLARRQGSAYAIREALEAHVRTPLVIIVPHDCVIARPVRLDAVAAAMHANPQKLCYVKLVGRSTCTYADAVLSQCTHARNRPDYAPAQLSFRDALTERLRVCVCDARLYLSARADGVRLQTSTAFGADVPVVPMLRYMDNAAMVSVRFLLERVFVPGSAVRRGTFIEDTFGKQTQMHAWLGSDEYRTKQPPSNGCFLLADGERSEPMMRHLDGKTYLDPEQRERAGLPAYPIDWTASLQEGSSATAADPAATPSRYTAADSAAAASSTSYSAADLVPLRDAICWDYMGGGCNAAACEKLKPRHAGVPVCGRHATTTLEMWGRRRRPPCPGDCGKAHPSLSELQASLQDALPTGSRLHVHVQAPPSFEHADAQRSSGSTSMYVAPRGMTHAAVEAVLSAQAPMALRVAIDVGFDGSMSSGERKSLATQCGIMHGIASQAEHRPHVSCIASASSAFFPAFRLPPRRCHLTARAACPRCVLARVSALPHCRRSRWRFVVAATRSTMPPRTRATDQERRRRRRPGPALKAATRAVRRTRRPPLLFCALPGWRGGIRWRGSLTTARPSRCSRSPASEDTSSSI